MAESQRYQTTPTHLDVREFEEFVFPHLSVGHRGPKLKLSLHTIFNYILKLLYMGCLWKELPIEKDSNGRPEIHYTRIYRILRRWEGSGQNRGQISMISFKKRLDILNNKSVVLF